MCVCASVWNFSSENFLHLTRTTHNFPFSFWEVLVFSLLFGENKKIKSLIDFHFHFRRKVFFTQLDAKFGWKRIKKPCSFVVVVGIVIIFFFLFISIFTFIFSFSLFEIFLTFILFFELFSLFLNKNSNYIKREEIERKRR